MRFLRVLCVLAIALCLTASVYAETQSVKVSGDLTMRGFFRTQYNYRGSVDETDTRGTTGNTVDQTWFMTNAEVQVDADLTDNVGTVIRLVNQRDWNVAATKDITSGTTLATNGLGGYTYNADEFQVAVDLAYVTLKDFIYSPLTITIGRQDLWFGKGFIVGANQQNPTSSISAPEYTSINSFDAIKAVLDYDPWTITGLYSKLKENVIQSNDDIDLWGINVGYKFNAYKGEAEAYWFYKMDNSMEKWGGIKGKNDIHNLGLRGSVDPIDVLTLAGEGVWQGGEYIGSRLQTKHRDRSAYALDFSGELRYWTDKVAWKPKLGLEYVLYSGNEPESNPDIAGATWHGYDYMYRGKFDSAIREFVGSYYASAEFPARSKNLQTYADASITNQHQLLLIGSIQPIESLTLKGNYNFFWTQEDYLAGNTKSGGFIGQEVDLQANWDYTEDVSFGLLAGWFVPGEVYQKNDKIATDIVGTVKVNF